MILKAILANEQDMNRMLVRMAHQIIEKNHGVKDLVLVGIHTRGVPLAHRLCENIAAIEGDAVAVGALDITLYRDDLRTIAAQPVVNGASIGFDVTGKTVVLVDDVIFTGRTARAALDATVANGRPARIQLCVLVDRGHAELPIKANYVGKNIPTSLDEVVSVKLAEIDGENSIGIYFREKDRDSDSANAPS